MTEGGREQSRQCTKLIEIQHETQVQVDLKLTLITEPDMQPTIRTTTSASPITPPTPKFVRMPTVLQITGLGRSTIYRLIAEKKFPVPVRVGDRAVAWRQVDLDAWSEGRLPSAH
ncbi:AlpA family transcriptional regulator [Rhizobacter sp. Root404]|uniref:helix-turn-helix transcriptional regulator n=1 Tax=Rhizobacter sp. Root404 TaxID=1736528 RepID=UPI001F3ED086|nr:AlpA family transcriptional regulator [Rhizobacter sp. Root404]